MPAASIRIAAARHCCVNNSVCAIGVRNSNRYGLPSPWIKEHDPCCTARGEVSKVKALTFSKEFNLSAVAAGQIKEGS